MILKNIQNALSEYYKLEQVPDVEHFLLDETHLGTLIEEPNVTRPTVFAQHQEGETFLGVYLAHHQSSGNILKAPDQLNLSDFCEIAEEVSHFVYLSWSLSNQLPRSLLDMEVQGEIDKWLLSNMFFPKIDNQFELHFENYELRSTLGIDEARRYETAIWLAAKLIKSFAQSKDVISLKEFYRQSSASRLSTLEIL